MCILHALPVRDRALPYRAPGSAAARWSPGSLPLRRAFSRTRSYPTHTPGHLNPAASKEEFFAMTKLHSHRFAKRALIAALASTALVAGANLGAKTLVFCSEGSPENFY